MRRRLAVCAIVVAMAAIGWAARRHPGAVRAASGTPGVLALAAPVPQPGCPLGAAFPFCAALTGGAGAAQTFTLSNASANAVTGIGFSFAAAPGALANFAAGDFTIGPGGTCGGGGALAAGANCTVNVSFTPTAAGPRLAALTATDSSGDTAYLNLAGSGGNLALTPPAAPACAQDDAFTFCATPTGGTSAAQPFTLATASGASSLQISFAATPGLTANFNAADFTIENPACPASLGANASCTILIAFTPTAPGLRAATLHVADSGGDAAQLSLAGATGGVLSVAPAAAPAPCWQSNPYGFCNEPTGGITPVRAYTLTNTSGGGVSGLSVTSPASDFLLSGQSCASTLAAGASCTLSIAFSPSAVGLRQRAFGIADAQGDATGLGVEGTGDDYELVVSLPSQITVAQGGSGVFNAQIISSGAFGQNGEQVTFVCASLYIPINTSCVVTPCPAQAVAGGSAPYQIQMATSSPFKAAPIPTVPCSAYGPSSSFAFVAPAGGARFGRGSRGFFRGGGAGNGRFPAPLPLIVLAALLAAAAAIARRRAAASPRPRPHGSRIVPLALACLALAAAALAGCHHRRGVNTDATPTGATPLAMLGNALDANGKTLNASRQFQVTLVVGP